MGLVHSLHVLIRSEEHQSAVVGNVSFQSLETLGAVVKRGICWIQVEVFISSDNRRLPAAIVYVVVNVQHVVSGKAAENVLMVGFRFG